MGLQGVWTPSAGHWPLEEAELAHSPPTAVGRKSGFPAPPLEPPTTGQGDLSAQAGVAAGHSPL